MTSISKNHYYIIITNRSIPRNTLLILYNNIIIIKYIDIGMMWAWCERNKQRCTITFSCFRPSICTTKHDVAVFLGELLAIGPLFRPLVLSFRPLALSFRPLALSFWPFGSLGSSSLRFWSFALSALLCAFSPWCFYPRKERLCSFSPSLRFQPLALLARGSNLFALDASIASWEEGSTRPL